MPRTLSEVDVPFIHLALTILRSVFRPLLGILKASRGRILDTLEQFDVAAHLVPPPLVEVGLDQTSDLIRRDKPAGLAGLEEGGLQGVGEAEVKSGDSRPWAVMLSHSPVQRLFPISRRIGADLRVPDLPGQVARHDEPSRRVDDLLQGERRFSRRAWSAPLRADSAMPETSGTGNG